MFIIGKKLASSKTKMLNKLYELNIGDTESFAVWSLPLGFTLCSCLIRLEKVELASYINLGSLLLMSRNMSFVDGRVAIFKIIVVLDIYPKYLLIKLSSVD